MRRRFTRSVLRRSGLAAAASAGLLALTTAVTTAAGAATASGPASPVISALPIAAAAAAGPQTFTTTYSCDGSSLNPTSSDPSPGDFTVNATLNVPASVVKGKASQAELSIQAASLPAAVAQKFPAVTSVSLLATEPLSGAFEGELELSGVSGPVSAQATKLPAMKALGELLVPQVGVVTLETAAQIQLTLNLPDGSSGPAIECAASNVTSIKINVTAPAPPTPPEPSGPDYSCVLSTNVPGAGAVPVPSGPLPFLATVTGSHTTGRTDLVSLAPDLGGNSLSELGGLAGSGIKGTAFLAEVPVTGAGHGAITVSGRTIGVSGKILTGAGRLFLANPGTYRLRAPVDFTFTLFGPTVRLAGQTIAVTIVMSCHLTSADSVLSALTATGPAVAVSGSGGGTSSGSGTAARGAVPAGAPNTGGGTPGSPLPLLAGGAALLLAGASGTVLALRRRRTGQPSS